MTDVTRGRAAGELADLRERISSRLVDGHLDVLAMPQTVGQVLRLLESPETPLARIAQAVGRDQAIAAHILALANSAFFRGAVPATTLEQAIVRLGLRELKGAVLMLSLKGLLRNTRFPHLARTLWRHSLATACVSRKLAQALGGLPDEAFVAGLIHDVGKMVVLTLYSSFDAEETSKVTEAALAEVLNEYHIEAGRLLASDWDLPAVAVEAVITHHANPITGIHSHEGRCVALANMLVHDMGFPSPGSPPASQDVQEACRQLNVDEEIKKALADEIPGMLEDLDASVI